MNLPTFRECIKRDEFTFINPNEFGTEHTIFGTTKCVAVVSENKSTEVNIELGYEYKVDIIVFIQDKFFAFKPQQGAVLIFDGKQYVIVEIYDNFGIYELHLSLVSGR